ncbi:MAG: alpha/beta hydrolase [Gammaproteobacteria bacterium]|nr:alpha/beta hydrolase [Gammaproteobacteria bacterium]
MSPEQLRILRYQLPPFGEGARPSQEMHAFCRFYGINFTERFPALEHLVGYVESGGFRLALHCWRQPDAQANLLIVHGYYDHTGLFGHLVEWGLANRCNVVIFDLPGHGLSTGAPAVIHDFSDYGRAIDAVLQRVWLPQLPLVAMAQSTGGAAIVEYARISSGSPWPFAATVLLAPLVRPAGWNGVRVAHTLLRSFVRSIPRTFAENTGNLQFLDFVRTDPLQCHEVPLAWVSALRRWLKELPREDLGVGTALIVQGDRDLTVDWRYNLEFMAQLFPGAAVEMIEGAGHQLANETPATRAHYLNLVAGYLVERGVFECR